MLKKSMRTFRIGAKINNNLIPLFVMDDFSGLKILMVDDTPANIDVLRRILSDEGFDISVTRRGKAALTWVKKTGLT